MENGPDAASLADDYGQLESMGYAQELPRLLRFWSNFAIGFAFISPIVGMYTVAALEVQTAGPAWVWSVVIVLAGPDSGFAVVHGRAFGSRWPIAGGPVSVGAAADRPAVWLVDRRGCSSGRASRRCR